MRDILVYTLLSLPGLTVGQAFPSGYSYDVSNIPSLTSGCQSALNATVKCNWMLQTYNIDSIDLTTANLTTICTSDCLSSLKSTRSSIASACPTASNQIVVEEIAYPATNTIDSLIDTYNKICLKESGTGKFCYDVMRSWQNETDLTPAQSCSDCLLDTLKLDQSSDFSYNADFVANFSSLTSSCGKTGYAPSTPTPVALNSTATATAFPTPICASMYAVQASDTCNGICKAHNVSTFELLYNNQLDGYCRNFPGAGTKLCMPPTCDIYTVKQNDTCRSVAAAQPGYVTITQIQAWNPNLNQLCTNMEQQLDMQICVSPPNTTYVAPTNTGANPTAPTEPAPVPTNAANGTTTRCGKWYFVQPGDTCGDITIRAYPPISLADFYFLNKGVNENCTNLLAQESYCILPVGDITTYPGYGSGYGNMTCTGKGSPSSCYSDYSSLSPTPFTATDSSNGTSPVTATSTASPTPTYTPLPLASGSYDSPKCGTFISYTDSGDDSTNTYVNSCDYVSQFFNITIDDLKTYNPSLSKANPCAIAQKYRYCVGLNGTSTSTGPSPTTTGNGITTPTPYQTGMTSSCKRFYPVQKNDGCYDIAQKYKASLDDFYSWNPAVHNDCSGLQPGYYVCVAVTGSTTSASPTGTPATTTTTGNGVTTPTPTQSGMVSNCGRFYPVQQNDGCYDIAQKYKIDLNDFYSWNPAVHNDCSGLQPGYYVCVNLIGGASSKPPTTTTPSGVATPTPSSPGMTAGCTKFYKAVPNDYCSKITQDNNISISDFEKWNPDVGSDCSLIRVDTYYCIAH